MIYHSDEIWKDVPHYEGIYQVSSFGNIRTTEGKTTFTKKHGIRHWKSRVLKTKGNKAIGTRVTLWKNGKPKDYLVARLVAMAFLGEPPKDFTVNHIDGNRLNNNISNLEWLSLKDNIRHGFKTGLYHNIQKPVEIKVNEKTIHFNAMAELDVYLNRSKGYTWQRVKNGFSNVIDACGKSYQIVFRSE